MIVYASDEPISFFVLKPAPDARVERSETQDHPRGLVLDSDEGQLVFAPAYLAAMHATPWATPLLLLGAAGLVATAARLGSPLALSSGLAVLRAVRAFFGAATGAAGAGTAHFALLDRRGRSGGAGEESRGVADAAILAAQHAGAFGGRGRLERGAGRSGGGDRGGRLDLGRLRAFLPAVAAGLVARTVVALALRRAISLGASGFAALPLRPLTLIALA